MSLQNRLDRLEDRPSFRWPPVQWIEVHFNGEPATQTDHAAVEAALRADGVDLEPLRPLYYERDVPTSLAVNRRNWAYRMQMDVC